MNKKYRILLGGKEVGITKLEKADVSMGVVFGEIIFDTNKWNYGSIKSYCLAHSIELTVDYPEDRYLSTRAIDSLIVMNGDGIVVKGVGNQISGMDSEGFKIPIEGIAFPFYEEEFLHHIKAYNELNEK